MFFVCNEVKIIHMVKNSLLRTYVCVRHHGRKQYLLVLKYNDIIKENMVAFK